VYVNEVWRRIFGSKRRGGNGGGDGENYVTSVFVMDVLLQILLKL
jgi:hypothetical protein